MLWKERFENLFCITTYYELQGILSNINIRKMEIKSYEKI